MKIKLVKITQLSGNKASIYTVLIDNDNGTLFDKFIIENKISFKSELHNLTVRLKTMGQDTGAREHFFKQFEGNPGDGVCALYDEPKSHLRLYCIRYGTTLVIVGGGGYKPKNIRALQEDPKLTAENHKMRSISQLITAKMSEGQIWFTKDYMEFDGSLELTNEDDEDDEND